MKSITTSYILLAVTTGHVLADGPADNNEAAVRHIPPAGIQLSGEDRAEIESMLDDVQHDIQALREQRDLPERALLPDVEVFARAVEQALRFDEFFTPADVDRARELLAEGRRRAAALATGEAPWLRQRGLVIRGYRSRLDDTVQPYGLEIPQSYDFNGASRYRCDLWFHGRGEKSVELQFVHQRMTQAGPIAPRDTIVLHPFGRYCNAFRFAGEVDVLEALAHAQSQYRIDEDRISDRGFSMGGAAAWQFAVRYSDRWFAANPGAGFSETPEFLRSFQQETLNPPWWEKTLWNWYDCPTWAMNLRQCPTIAYSGEIDRQKQAADVMAEACRKYAFMELTHIIGPQTAHAIHPGSKVEIERRLEDLAVFGRQRVPPRVRLRTYTLKYDRMHWLTINGLDEHWVQAGVDAQIELNSHRLQVFIRADGVAELTLQFAPGEMPADVDGPPQVVFVPGLHREEGAYVADLPPLQSDRSWTCRLYRDAEGTWHTGSPPWDNELRKRHDLQGPIDDALMDSFLFVTPGGKSRHDLVEDWTHSELHHALTHWRQQMRGDARVKSDADVTDADIAAHNLILWGDPTSNAVLGRIADKLPILWGDDQVAVGGQSFDAETHVPLLIYPNPLNPRRYVVLNSSFTYREYDYLNNARQTPKLPDWAIVDLRELPGSRRPGKIVAADFFDERWKLKPPHPLDH
jgi:hypothetical protein